MSQGVSQVKRVFGVLLVLVGVGLSGGAAGADSSPTLAQLADDMENIGIDADSDTGRFLRSTPRERAAALSEEVKEVRVAQQFGLGYLPLVLVRQYGLIEQHARRAGLGEIRVTWSRFPSGKVMNDALKTGLLDIASGGVAPLVSVWDKTHDGVDVKGLMALCSMPMYLNTVNPRVRSLRDFTDADRIALPAAKVSGQAVVLQMAAAQTFGADQATRLDGITVSMSHPEAMEAMLAGKAGITAHLASPPFQDQELDDPRVRRVLDSYTVLGGMSTFNLVWARENFYRDNPGTVKAVVGALRQAMDMIRRDPAGAAREYVLQTNSSLSVEYVEQVIRHPQIAYTHIPVNVMRFASFMFEQGAIENELGDWRDLFFELMHGEQGS